MSMFQNAFKLLLVWREADAFSELMISVCFMINELESTDNSSSRRVMKVSMRCIVVLLLMSPPPCVLFYTTKVLLDIS